MKLDRKNFLAAGGAAAAAASFGFPAVVRAAGEPIRLGGIPCLTGSNALLGQQEHEGLTLAIEEINARPGKVYDDRPFELVEEDATNDNQSAVSALNKLLGENVVAIVCPVLSTQVQAMAPVMKTHEIPWMTGGTAVKNTQLGVTSMFRLRASDGITAAAMTNFAVKEKKAKKIAIMHASDAFGTGGADQIVQNLQKLGMTPVANEQYPKDAKDFTAEILKVKQSGADALLMYIQNPSDTAIILKQIRSLGLSIPIVGSPSLANQTAMETAGKDANGAYSAVDFIVGFNSNKATHFLTAFYRKFHHQPDVGTGSGWVYDAVYMLADTYRKQKSTDPAKTIASLKAVKNWEGVLGTFDADGEGNMVHSVSIGQIADQKLHLVKKVTG
ncbi:ABC transporter substrate-binding protein [Vulcanimicrobium alpinum]|uniref:ABC transporter substrate-binding protein n=1 Tax=Vulcanimicrobium alpinum TaxID=3016050 RepID=A0AAN2CA64_UNVUL|nr:ABC transporter substrate-binding protein [Vulcanimicrobium alpinum]BDE06746.1 ABC transporter substrate-binding protein [Vulcanimicrobium alpinum]